MPTRRAPTRRGRPRDGAAGPFALRVGRAADLPTLVLHRHKMWRDIRRFRPGELDRHDVEYAAWVRRQWRAGKFLALLAEAPSGAVVASGCLWLMPSQPRPGPLGRGVVPYILSMYTEPRARGRGLASRIVRAMVAWSAEHGYRRVLLHASRLGRPVYERLGFVESREMRLPLRAPRKGRRAGKFRALLGAAGGRT